MKALFQKPYKAYFLLVLSHAFNHVVIAQDTASMQSKFLHSYYNIKNALVAGDSRVAAANAQEFIKITNGIDYKVISEGNINVLLKDAGKIAETTDLKKQRTYFSNLSHNTVSVAKVVKFSGKSVYVQYCPMQDSYWLSHEKEIRNPYYGSSMLTCGKVTETIQLP